MKSTVNGAPEGANLELVSGVETGFGAHNGAVHNGVAHNGLERDNGSNGLVPDEIEVDLVEAEQMKKAADDSSEGASSTSQGEGEASLAVDSSALVRPEALDELLQSVEDDDEEAEDSLDEADDETDTELQPCPMVWVSPQRIVPDPNQPRTRFTRASLRSLTKSVRQHGVLQPITVCRLLPAATTTNGADDANQVDEESHHEVTAIEDANGNEATDGHEDAAVSENATGDEATDGDAMMKYQIIAGERRWRAAVAAGLTLVPVIVRDGLSPTTVAEVALVENLQRTDLDPIEEARGYLRLIREFSLSEDRVAKRVGRSRDSIRQSLKLLQLPQAVQELIAEGKLTPTHGQVLRKFARFTQLCEAVANTCVEYEVPANSLAQEIPNDDELIHDGLLVYLARFNTEFDFQRVCRRCPHKAFWQDGFGRMYCFKPAEWEKKQQQAQQEKQQLQHDEASRIMAQAAEDGQHTVEVTQLPPGSYRDLSSTLVGSGLNPLPQGCTPSCPCRSMTELRGRKDIPVCLDPARFAQLGIEQRQREKEARVRMVSALSERARAVVVEEWRTGRWQKLAPVLASTLLRAQRPLLEEAARKLNLAFPLSRFFDRKGGDHGKWQVLAEQDSDQVLALAALVLVMKEAKDAVEWSDHDLFTFKAVLNQLNEPQAELPSTDEQAEEVVNPFAEAASVKENAGEENDATSGVSSGEVSADEATKCEAEESAQEEYEDNNWDE